MSRRTPEKRKDQWEQWTMPEPTLPVSAHQNGWNAFGGHQSTYPQPQMSTSSSYPGAPPPLPLRGTFQSDSARPRTTSHRADGPAEPTAGFWAFPQPEVEMSSPQALSPPPVVYESPRHSGQNSEVSSHWGGSDRSSIESSETLPSTVEYTGGDELSKQMSQMQIQKESIQRFQEGNLPPEDEEWHRLCSADLRNSLPKNEVQRQSTIFEVIKSERDYVLDLQMIESIFILPLLSSDPPIISPPEVLEDFITEVFSNVAEIEKIHQRMVASLFRRQRKEHPIITSIADIILDASLSFQEQYEVYIKHYPIAEGRHRHELKENAAYAQFIEKAAQDTRTRKRDLITLISRPVTRLPRLALMVEHIHKLTAPDHSDLESLPIALNVLNQLLKSTQPGIAAAEGKVKLRNLIESLVFDKGEMIDLDPSNENRTLVYTGPLARQDTKGWTDFEAGLLDNYLVMTRSEVRAGITKYIVVSRPIPLEFLQLGSFTLPSEPRKVKADSENSSRFTFFNKDTVQVFPFVISHAGVHGKRKYTLYATSDSTRKKWHESFQDAIGLRQAQQEANRIFAIETMSDSFFRSLTTFVPVTSPLRQQLGYFTGKMTCAARFSFGGHNHVVVGCAQGVYIAYASQAKSLRKALNLPNPVALGCLGVERDGQLIVLQDGKLMGFPLEDLAKIMTLDPRQPRPGIVPGKVATHDAAITLMKVGTVAGKRIVAYAVKHFRHTTIHALELSLGRPIVPTSPVTPSPANISRTPSTFVRYGSSFYVPKDASDIVLLDRGIAVPAGSSIAIVDPTQPESHPDERVVTVPNFANCNPASGPLKLRCQSSIAIGIIPYDEKESLLILDTFGIFISKHGYPTRGRQYVRWETKVVSYICRSQYLLLINPEWIEIRHIGTGRLEQVVHSSDIRLLENGGADSGSPLLAMRGEVDDASGLTDRLMEALETRPLHMGGGPSRQATYQDPQWSEWGI